MNAMIKGIQKTSLIDYPGKIACTLFLGGCNFRCGYCYNSDLVFRPNTIPNIPEEKILSLLFSRRDWLDGVCITGGEPTIHKRLPKLCNKIKELNYEIKLDTNGTNPEMLKELITNKLIDYVAMDIKASLKNYHKVAEASIMTDKIKKSISLIMGSDIDYEFRTTVIPDIITKEEIKQIGRMIKGAKKYFIQQFQCNPKTVNKKYNNMNSLPKADLNAHKKIAEKYVCKVELRNC